MKCDVLELHWLNIFVTCKYCKVDVFMFIVFGGCISAI